MIMTIRFAYGLVSAAVLLFGGTTINASIISASDTDDDAVLTLRIEDTLIKDVNQKWGEVRITIVDDDVVFTSGDSVEVSVYEDDIVGDDLLFQEVFVVSNEEIAAGLVDRTFSVVFTPTSDLGDQAEIYALAVVDKDQCGLFCIFDRPQTMNIQVNIVAEPVPTPATAWLFGWVMGLLLWTRRTSVLNNI